MSGIRNNETKAKVKQLIEEGKSYREVARILGIKSPNTVFYYAKDIHVCKLRSLGKTQSFYRCVTCKKYFQQVFLSAEAMKKLGKVKSLEETE